jgi:DNA polymerase-1
MDESVMLVQLFKQTYPRVVQFWKEAIALAKQKGYAETAGGRRVYFDPADWDYRSDPKRAYASEQTAINFPVQGTGADQKFLGIALTDAYAYPRGAIYMLDLHDALFYLIPDDGHALETACEIKHILNTLPYKEVFGWTPTVPMPVDAKLGLSWGDMETI